MGDFKGPGMEGVHVTCVPISLSRTQAHIHAKLHAKLGNVGWL